MGSVPENVEQEALRTRSISPILDALSWQMRAPSLTNWLIGVPCLVLLAGGTLSGDLAAAAARPDEFTPGEVWLDTEGNPIDAHGGGVLQHGGVYYWYGEDRGQPPRGSVSCYVSTNLLEWKRLGAALLPESLPRINDRRTFVERPKVIFNPSTKKFVMWMHVEQGGYRFSRAGIAVSDHPEGPFTFLQAIRPVANTNDFASLTNDSAHQKEYGATFRDMTLFVDEDGRAYVFYSAEDNWTMYVVRLNMAFTGPELPAVENKTWARILVRQMREGAAPFKYRGKYYLITSACTGWKPNKADCAVADSIFGPYRALGNPCRGPDAERTFGAQSTCVLPTPNKPGSFIFMADRWVPSNLADSRYVWLPLEFDAAGTPVVQWRERWSLPTNGGRPDR
jgi:hypothetical protein